MHSELAKRLKDLHLPSFRSLWETMAQTASEEGWTYADYLLELVRAEHDERQNRKVERLLRQSKLPLEKNLESLDMKRMPTRVGMQLGSLKDGKFLDRRENVLVFGNPGSGKTHLACALGQELIRQGRRVYFCTCSLLVQELLKAKSELKLPKLLKRFSKFEAMVIDDIGYVQQSREEMEVLFTLLAERYERGSVLITSNLPFSKWENIFKDPMTTAAAIDRLVHHSVILELNISSYRMEVARKRGNGGGKKMKK